MERMSIQVIDVQTMVTCSRIEKGAQHVQRIQRVCSNTAKKYRYIPRQTQSQQLISSISWKSIGFIKLPCCNFCSVWGPNSPPARAARFCFMWRGSPPPTYHPAKSTARERYEGWCWILGSERSNRRSLLGAETPVPPWKGNSQQVHSDSTTLPYLYKGALLFLCTLNHGQSQELLAMLNQPCFGWLDIITPRYLKLAFWALCAWQPQTLRRNTAGSWKTLQSLPMLFITLQEMTGSFSRVIKSSGFFLN